MGIEGNWWEGIYEDHSDYEICPECGGSGKDNDSLDHPCYTCNGMGRVKMKKKKYK